MRRERRYVVPKNRVQLGRAVTDAMQRHEFLAERPTFSDPREQRIYERLLLGCRIVALLGQGEKLTVQDRAVLTRLGVRVNDGKVVRWGELIGDWMVKSYGHPENLRVGDTWHWRHPQYVKSEPLE